jgi:hypothetical protein
MHTRIAGSKRTALGPGPFPSVVRFCKPLERRVRRRSFLVRAAAAPLVVGFAQWSAPREQERPLRFFPPDNAWNTDISAAPVDPNSAALIASIGLDRGLHPDFGTVWNGAPNGIPYVVVGSQQPKVPVSFEYADESDPGRIPFRLTCRSRAERILLATDAAGLPILPGLVRYDEVVEQGSIEHALRFTTRRTRRAYVPPARHLASRLTDPNLPPMGMRVRLRASFDTTPFPTSVQVILNALKTYGMFVADNGSDWYVGGAPDPRWTMTHWQPSAASAGAISKCCGWTV